MTAFVPAASFFSALEVHASCTESRQEGLYIINIQKRLLQFVEYTSFVLFSMLFTKMEAACPSGPVSALEL